MAASTQTGGLKTSFKDLAPSFKGNAAKRQAHREDTPIKKRVMAEINLKRRGPPEPLPLPPRTPKVKREQAEEAELPPEAGGGEVGGAKALDLSPGLKHTLAQFTLSSQSSLGGPAAFSARGGPPESSSSPLSSPLPSSPPTSLLGAAPLLVPCDSSTELTHSVLEGESISCFAVGGEKRLCLPQVLNSVLRDFSLQQINSVCDELYVYCSRCDGEQLHILKVLGVLPFNAPSCGLITLTDAQRLCNALLRPGGAAPPTPSAADPSGKPPSARGLLKESEDSFQVEHQCLGKCQGLFVPRFYTHADAPCVQCLECRLLFSPQKFVMHSHRAPDKRTCHWGFDSAKWPCYLLPGRGYLGGAEEPRVKRLLDEMKEKFSCRLKSSLDKALDDEAQLRRSSPELCSPADKMVDPDPGSKGRALPAMLLNRLFSTIKEEPSPTALLHPSYFLYTYDKMVAPNVSLRREAELSPEMLGALLKHHYSRTVLGQDQSAMDLHSSPAPPSEGREATPPPEAVSMETSPLASSRKAAAHSPPPLPPRPSSELGGGAGELGGGACELGGGADDLGGGACEDDKNLIMVEIVQMYSRQQEKLNLTMQKQLQLEMELSAVRGGEAARLRELCAERAELQTELEALQTEQSERLAQSQRDQRDLERRLDQLRQQSCACEPGARGLQEGHYTAQLAVLRDRLRCAEAERGELQEELRGEREAREKLERLVHQLRRQTAAATATPGASPSPPPTPSSPPSSSSSSSAAGPPHGAHSPSLPPSDAPAASGEK